MLDLHNIEGIDLSHNWERHEIKPKKRNVRGRGWEEHEKRYGIASSYNPANIYKINPLAQVQSQQASKTPQKYVEQKQVPVTENPLFGWGNLTPVFLNQWGAAIPDAGGNCSYRDANGVMVTIPCGGELDI